MKELVEMNHDERREIAFADVDAHGQGASDGWIKMTCRQPGESMAITKAELDNAIATGTPLNVRVEGGSAFLFTITDYDRRIVRGSYLSDGKPCGAAFHRSDLAHDRKTGA